MPVRNGFSELAALILRNSEDVDSIQKMLTTNYTVNDLVVYLKDDDPLVSRPAAIAIGFIGNMDAVPILVENLKNDDLRTCFNTEMALWNIWSRSGNESVDKMFQDGKRSLKNEKYSEAIDIFTKVIETQPNFAEGYNQRAIAYFMIEAWEQSLHDCQQTIELNPHHFGAFAGMGHVYLRLGKIDHAIDAYKQALVINPNLTSIAEALIELRNELQEE